ncbi:MAG TPA: phytase [Nocardioidaceae bacterium]|nr:phytase [Nocardioidaceae bacterium]
MLGVGTIVVLTQSSAVARTYAETVVADGAVSYWRLGELSGATAADSAGSNPGSYQGGVTLGEPGALTGDSNTSMLLTGNDGRMQVPSASNLNFTGDFTLEAWARPNSLSGSTQAVMHKGGTSGTRSWQYRLSVASNGRWRGVVYVNQNAYNVTSTATASTTAFSHVVMVKAGNRITLFVNGAQADTRTFSGSVNTSTGQLALGRTGSTSSDYFRGGIDEAAVYNRALTAAEVANHHQLGTTAEPPDAPVADFTASPTSGTAPLNVVFSDTSTGNPSSWAWDFGDGSSSTVQNPTHQYTQAGTYTVSLTVSNAGGSDVETKTNLITVSPAPEPTSADFTGSPTSGVAPLEVSFTDTSTGAPTSWSWSFGDGGTSTQQNPTHVYDEPGTYTVALTANGPGGADTETKTGYITVTAAPVAPTASFTASPTSGTAPLTVSFTDTSTGAPTSWSWDFGDGGTSTQQNPTHVYDDPGTYTVTLTATNGQGSDTVTRTNLITVSAVQAPVASFTATPTSGTAPLTVAFTDTSTNSPTSWSWDFGDGGTSTAQNPSHEYAEPGTYTVVLTATNAGGSDTVTRTDLIQVSEAPAGPVYRDVVLGDGPVGYWRLGETSGTSAADETGAPPGTLVGGITTGLAGALTGDPNTAMRFNGSTGYAQVNNRSNLNFTSGDFSIEAWAQPEALTSMAVLQKGGTGGYSSWQYRLSVTSTGRWRGTVFVGGSNITVTSPAAPSTTKWTHLVLVRSGTSLRLFVDGVQVATTTFTGNVNTSTGMLALGRSGASSSDYFRGGIDEVAIYPTALTAAQIDEHYDAATTGGPPPPPDGEAPTVQLTNPVDGASYTTSQTVDVTATATDNIGVSRVEFYDGGTLLGTDTTSPYSVPWQLTSAANGSHTITARAFDAAGNSTTSNAATVTVSISAPGPITPTVETDPMPNSGDSADDSAIWVHPTNPSLSTVIGTDKQGGIAVYDLSGNELFYYSGGEINNVDIRYGFPLGGGQVDLVAASNYDNTNSIALWRVDPTTRGLVPVAARTIGIGAEIYGMCMYHSAVDDEFYAFATVRSGGVQQWRLFDNGSGQVDATRVRSFSLTSITEGCVADDELGHLYVSQEDVGIWKYGAEPGAGTTRTQVDSTSASGNLDADVEGLTIYYGSGGTGYLIASSQGSSDFVVYRRESTNAFVTRFGIVSGAIDGVSVTDGIDVASVPLGSGFPEGVFVAQDNTNTGGNQNFKLVPWGTVARGTTPNLTIDTSQNPRLR